MEKRCSGWEGDPTIKKGLSAFFQPSQRFVSHVKASQGLGRKCRKSWLAQSGSVRRMALLPGTTFIRKAPCILISLNRGPYIACGNNRGGAYCGLWIIRHVEIQTGCKDVTSAHMYKWEWRGGGNKANFPVGGSDSVKRPAIVARHVRH